MKTENLDSVIKVIPIAQVAWVVVSAIFALGIWVAGVSFGQNEIFRRVGVLEVEMADLRQATTDLRITVAEQTEATKALTKAADQLTRKIEIVESRR